jgi:hypothetical protein
MISKGGGSSARWRSDGLEIFYTLGAAQQMAADIISDTAFRVGIARRLFGFPGLLSSPDVARDGKRFLFTLPQGADAPTPFIVVLNWQAALKK